MVETQEAKNSNFEKRVKLLEELTRKHSELIEIEQAKTEALRTDVDKTQGVLSALKSDFTSFRADTNTRITNNKDDLQD